MKHIALFVFAFALGCSQTAPSVQPAIDEATGLKLAYQLSFVVESADSRPLGCATLLTVDDDSFCVATPLELASQSGCRIIEWRGEFDGQKFERVVFNKFEVVSSEPSLKMAILRVSGTTTKQAIEFAITSSREFHSSFAAYSSQRSQPRPIQAVSVKASGLISARAAPDQSSAYFFKVEDTLDLRMLGSPLVTQHGELAAVAVGNFYNSTLYCPASSISKLLAKGRDGSDKTSGAVPKRQN